jgi:outer membrane protein OmpA-like peptidoglycan-associated protein
MKVIAALALIMTSPVWALDLKGHQFSDAYRYSLLEDGFTERFAGKNVFLASYGYVDSPFYFTDKKVNSLRSDIISHSNVLTLGYTRYLTDKLAAGVDIVGVENKILDKSFVSFGDTVLRAKYLLTDRSLDWGLSLNPFISLPTGRERTFTSTGSVAAGARAVFEKHLSRLHFLGSAGYSHASGNKLAIVDQRNQLLTQLGVSLDLTSAWNINAEVLRNFTFSSYRQDEGDYFLTAKNKRSETLNLYAGMGVAGLEEVERNNFTVFAGIKWSEAVKPIPAPIVPAAIPPKPENRQQEAIIYGPLLKLENVYFANNSSKPATDEKKKILEVIQSFKELGDNLTKVVIEGYASQRGTHAYNLALSKRRTIEVFALLKAAGLPESKMELVSYGDQLPQDPEEWKNRRVQFRVYKKNESI